MINKFPVTPLMPKACEIVYGDFTVNIFPFTYCHPSDYFQFNPYKMDDL